MVAIKALFLKLFTVDIFKQNNVPTAQARQFVRNRHSPLILAPLGASKGIEFGLCTILFEILTLLKVPLKSRCRSKCSFGLHSKLQIFMNATSEF